MGASDPDEARGPAIPELHREFLGAALPRRAADPRLLGVAAGGPLAAGAMDAWSDLDLVVVARPDAEVARELRALGVPATDPALWPEYAPDSYATFFEDPDGIRLEVVAETALRRTVREAWDRLADFVDPVDEAGLRP